MSNKSIRNMTRILHIIAGALISALVYSPLQTNSIYIAAMQFIVIPGLIVSGIFLWQQARILKLFRPNRRTG